MKRGTGFSVLVLIVFALAGYLAYSRLFQQPDRTMSEVVVCTNCHHVFVVTFPIGKGGAPYICPECGAKSAYLAFQCTDPSCQAIFAVEPEEMGFGETTACPVCGRRGQRLNEVPPRADALAEKAAEETAE
jgi:hypothetical protein